MEKVLFITNELFVDHTKQEGGVRLCTEDYIHLLESKYEVERFLLSFNTSLLYRFKAKIGIDVFEDYDEKQYLPPLKDVINKNKIHKVFINLSSASRIAKILRNNYKDKIKIILCSHGFESGDFLHQSVRFQKFQSFLQNKTSAWRLGKILQKELEFRLSAIDLVLTVSEVEVAIENWIGAKKVFFVPRIFKENFIPWHPVLGRVGFIADLSHYPNYFGLLQICQVIKLEKIKNIEIRVSGKMSSNLEILMKEFPFVNSLGYMEEKALVEEAGTWMYYLNLVFYYSKGVSTKLAKGMNWGLPVLTTPSGNRGYLFNDGAVCTVKGPGEMVEIITNRINNSELLFLDKINVEKAVLSFNDFSYIMKDLEPVLHSL